MLVRVRLPERPKAHGEDRILVGAKISRVQLFLERLKGRSEDLAKAPKGGTTLWDKDYSINRSTYFWKKKLRRMRSRYGYTRLQSRHRSQVTWWLCLASCTTVYALSAAPLNSFRCGYT